MPSASATQRSTLLGLLAVLCLFCAPLFVGLTNWDLDNDEAIYAYAVDRMLETGDWLTPRSMPNDGPFLEKPPLKFWIAAAAIRTGLLPHDEFGLRFFDALFGAIAFMYVFSLGRLLAGSVCGFVAVLVLFTLDPLIFEHGLRSNNMEAPLFLAFCGGVYHFARWVEDDSGKAASRHALAVALYFTLGFMTKFVAILFLPLVCALAMAWRHASLQRLRSGWRDWITPLVCVVAVTGPWFVYQAFHSGSLLWETMFEAHVIQRFTAVLDMRQLRPWNYYYSQLWLELILVGSHWIAALGAAVVAWKAWRGRPWLARLLFVWGVLPMVLISFGTSKLFHYVYPFLPPLALGAGAVAAALFRRVDRLVSTFVARRGTAVPAPVAGWRSKVPAWSLDLLFAGAVAGLGVAALTAMTGRVEWEIGELQLLRNSSIARPLVLGALLLYLSGYFRASHIRTGFSRAVAFAFAAILLPILAYPEKIERTMSARHPLRTLRDCALSFSSSRPPETHVHMPYEEMQSHSYYYYLRRVGPWIEHERPRPEALRGLVSDDRVMLMTNVDYAALDQEVGAPRAVTLTDRSWVVIVPTGQLESCTTTVAVAGARETRRSRRTAS